MNLSDNDLLTLSLIRERALTGKLHLMTVHVKDLLQQIDHLGSIRFSRDIEPYKAEMVWDTTVWKLRDMVKKYEQEAGGEAKVI
jgi:hypothetical protein